MEIDGETILSIRRKPTSRKRKAESVSFTCGDCVFLTPDMERLSIQENRPILGRCPNSKYMRLLSDNTCNKFEKTKEE